MRIVMQRARQASVEVDGETVAEIGPGLLVLVGVAREDTLADAAWLAEKTAGLRVFADKDGRMNLSVRDVDGQVLAVSQFTLYGDCNRGRRPSFSMAERPDRAESLYQAYVAALRRHQVTVQTGSFGAHMRVALVNDGPVTLVIDHPA